MGSRILFLAVSFFAVVALGDESTTEFNIKKQYYRDRLDDYYDRLETLDRQDADRRKGEDDTRVARKRKAEVAEQARQEYVKQRKPKSELDETGWEIELKARKVAMEKARQDFVQKRDEMKRNMSHFDQIDANEELGIEQQLPAAAPENQ